MSIPCSSQKKEIVEENGESLKIFIIIIFIVVTFLFLSISDLFLILIF